MTKNKRILVFGALLFISLFLSACGSVFGASSWPGITYDEDRNAVYVAYNQHVFALQAENGVEIWRFPGEAENGVTFYAPPVLTAEGALIASGFNNQLYSLNPDSNGSQSWAFAEAEDRFIGSVAASDGSIYAPNADHKLYALADSGQMQWSFAAGEAIWSAPVTDGEKVFIASMDHKLYALRAQGGTVLWEQDMGGTVVADPAMDANGQVYVGTFGQEILAVNGENGVIQWRTSTEDWIWGGPTLSDGVLYVGDFSGTLYALDTENGRELWRVSTDGAVTGSPLVANEHVYVSTENGQVLSVNLDGRIQWTQSVQGQAYSSPVLAGDLILVGIVEGDDIVVALDGNGNRIWSFGQQN